MSSLTDDDILVLLQAAVPAVVESTARDLWPAVRARIETPPRRSLSRADWLLISGITLVCILRPALVSVLLFHF